MDFFIKDLKSKGMFKNRYLIMSMCSILATIFGLFAVLIPPSILLMILNTGVILSIIILYFGLREKSIEQKEKKPVKKTNLQDGIFRVSKVEPGKVIEEDITYFRELKKCLVCKNKAEGFNVYICHKCEALSCQKCASSLSDLENACWSCNHPFDPAKAAKPYQKEEEIVVEKEKDHQKINE